MTILSTFESPTFDETIKCASKWFILTWKTQNLEVINLKCMTYAQPFLSQDCTDIDSLVKCYNQTCTEVLDAHARSTVRLRTIRRKLLWFNEVVEDARRVRKRYERKFRKSHSEVDQEAYFDAKKKQTNKQKTKQKKKQPPL